MTERPGDWVLMENPSWEGRNPTPMRPACHDGSPFLTILCSCGEAHHQHESRVGHIPDDTEIASRCQGCGRTMVFPPGFFKRAFAEMRAAGWYA